MPGTSDTTSDRPWDSAEAKQIMLTAAIPFAVDRADAVDRLLGDFVPQLRSEGRIREVLRDQGIHFLTITVVRDGPGRPAHLMLEVNADGLNETEIWHRLADRLAPCLEEIRRTAGMSLPAPLGEALARHSIRTRFGLFGTAGITFHGTPQMTASRIRNEYLLAREIRTFFDAGTALAKAPLETLADLRRHIGQNAQLAPLLDKAPLPDLEPPGGPRSAAKMIACGVLTFLWPVLLVLAGLVILVTWAAAGAAGYMTASLVGMVALLLAVLVLVGLVLGLYAALRSAEQSNIPDDSLPDAAILSAVIAHENWSVQNHLAGISVMETGYLRRLTLRLAFWVIAQLVTHKFRAGYLGELGTIHFARWVLLPGTNKLLFFSNYGGSWESYLEDFITRASPGLTAVWSNTSGFPRTRNLFTEGATDGDRFKRWARRQQQPTRFWYSAYPHLTTERIRTNARLRHALNAATTPEKAKAWLAGLSSRPRSAGQLETAEIQTLLFGGLGTLPHSACLALRLPDDPGQARDWLRRVLPQVSFGDQPPRQQATILSFAASGLKRLGLPDPIIAQFPVAYGMGMAHPARANILSDTGDDRPATWLWGSGQAHADAVLLVYADTGAALEAALTARKDELEAVGGQVICRVTPDPLPDREKGQPRPAVKEPFGFVDGISQPIIRGTRRWMRQKDAIHHVEPGEFLYGYPDGRGYFPPSPVADQSEDPAGLLAGLPSGGSVDKGLRDFGRNGTFLVIRQLEQDVGVFNSFVEDAARKAEGHPAVPASLTRQDEREDWIAAKMVGRWKDGRSLMRYPHHPVAPAGAAVPDNAFLYGAEDPGGERCPFGAHIRRSNPRDSKLPGSADEIAISNRHRILRVGRSFSAKGSGDPAATKPGLLFICLNLDIERQFEFIQQTWAMAWQFHGLENEVDPLIVRGVKEDGKPRRLARLTIPSPQGPLHLTDIRDFIRMRGGGYFFMPGRQTLQYLSALGQRPKE